MNANKIPYIIIGAFVAFALFIGSFVIRMFQSDINLVAKDYYQQEIAYGEQIEAIKRSENYFDKIDFTLTEGKLSIEYDQLLNDIEGSIVLFRPSDARLDMILPIQMENGIQQLNVSSLKRGKWMLQFKFEKEGQSFYIEKPLSI